MIEADVQTGIKNLTTTAVWPAGHIEVGDLASQSAFESTKRRTFLLLIVILYNRQIRSQADSQATDA